MPGYKDWVNGAILSESDLDDFVGKQVVFKYASAAARDADATLTAALREGMVCYLDLTNTLCTYHGGGWSTIGPVSGVGTAWTPAIVQLGAVTSTTSIAEYTRNGRWIEGSVAATITSAGTAANIITMSLPVTAAATAMPAGEAVFVDASSGNEYATIVRLASASTFKFHIPSTVSTPFLGLSAFMDAVVSGDSLYVNFKYRAATDN